jgi:hypothetical protein
MDESKALSAKHLPTPRLTLFVWSGALHSVVSSFGCWIIRFEKLFFSNALRCSEKSEKEWPIDEDLDLSFFQLAELDIM